MNELPIPGSPARRGLFGVLRSWLLVDSGDHGRSPEFLAAEIGRPHAHDYGPVRVLVVDDNPVNLMAVSALLESRGLVPLLAADGAQAVALVCESPFDLILMDLQMPILDGLGATSAIRRFEAASARPAVPVLAYSSACPGAGVLERHGFNGSLRKPCADQELESCLRQWCPTYRCVPARQGPAVRNGRWQPRDMVGGSDRAALGRPRPNVL